MLTLFFWYGLIVVACATGNDGHGLRQTQIDSHSSQQHPQSFRSYTQEAEDRNLYAAHKYWIKRKKRKYKLFKRHFEKCGDPFNFKFIKRADDDPDTISIKLPHGFGDDYYPPEGIQTDDESDTNGLYDESDEDGDKLGGFTQKLTPIRTEPFKPVYPRISSGYKPNRLPPQRIFLRRHKPWIPVVTPWKTSNPSELNLRVLHHHGSLLSKSPMEIPMERNNPIPNYVYQNDIKLEVKPRVKPKRRISPQTDFYKFYKISTDRNESTSDKEKIVTVTPMTPFLHGGGDDSWMPVLDGTNENYRRAFPDARTDEPEIITAKLENSFVFRNHSQRSDFKTLELIL